MKRSSGKAQIMVKADFAVVAPLENGKWKLITTLPNHFNVEVDSVSDEEDKDIANKVRRWLNNAKEELGNSRSFRNLLKENLPSEEDNNANS